MSNKEDLSICFDATINVSLTAPYVLPKGKGAIQPLITDLN